MRTRTDAKRQGIIDTAAELFLALGYERTSMSMIAQKLGGSKATLYGYFKSKEELLLAILADDVKKVGDDMFEATEEQDIESRLRNIGLRLLKGRLYGRPPRMCRMVATMPEDSDVGRTFYEESIIPAQQRLCALMSEMIDNGILRKGNPRTMTMHFMGLVDGDFFERVVLWPSVKIGEGQIEQAVTDAVDVFLRAYRA